MRIRYVDMRDALLRQKKQATALRSAFGFCPACGRPFFGRGTCRRCRKESHITKGQGVRHA